MTNYHKRDARNGHPIFLLYPFNGESTPQLSQCCIWPVLYALLEGKKCNNTHPSFDLKEILINYTVCCPIDVALSNYFVIKNSKRPSPKTVKKIGIESGNAARMATKIKHNAPNSIIQVQFPKHQTVHPYNFQIERYMCFSDHYAAEAATGPLRPVGLCIHHLLQFFFIEG